MRLLKNGTQIIGEEYDKRTNLIFAKILGTIPLLPQPERSSGSTQLKRLQNVYAENVLEAVAHNLKRFPGIAAWPAATRGNKFVAPFAFVLLLRQYLLAVLFSHPIDMEHSVLAVMGIRRD